MSIRFTCSCGKRIKARDEMAGRRSMCPRCGEPVGIPGNASTHPDGAPAAPLPQDRRRFERIDRAAAERGQRAIVPPLVDPLTAVTPVLPAGVPLPEGWPNLPQGAKGRIRSRRTWKLETRWQACLLYPLRALILIAPLAVLLTLLTLFTAMGLPRLLDDAPTRAESWLRLAGYVVGALFALGYVYAFLDGVLASGVAGEVGVIRWPGRDLTLILRSMGILCLSFLAGPALLTLLIGYYWVQAGDLDWLDKLILAELGFLALNYWLLALAAMHRDGVLAGISPQSIGRLVDELGARAWAAGLAVTLLGAAHVVAIFQFVGKLDEDEFSSSVVLLLLWSSVLFFVTFFMRLIGVWVFWLGVHVAASGDAEKVDGKD